MGIAPVALRRFEFVEPKTKTVFVSSDLTGKKASTQEQTLFSATVEFNLQDANRARELFKALPAFTDTKQKGTISYYLTTPAKNIVIKGCYNTSTLKEVYECVGQEYVPAGRGITDDMEPAHYEGKYGWVTKEVNENHTQTLKIENSEQFYELMILFNKLAKSTRLDESQRHEMKALKTILREAGTEFRSGATSIAKEKLADLTGKLQQRLATLKQKEEKLKAKSA